MSDNTASRGFTTAILHGDRDAVIEHGALHKPLHLSVAYGFDDARDLAAVFQGRQGGFVYGRQGNPTSAALEAKVTAMEEGVATVCFSTGMAAIAAVFSALLKAGDHVVSSHFLFGNTNSLFQTLESHGTPVTFVDATSVQGVEAALRPETRIVFVETIANPRTQVADVARIGELCAARGILYVVDNTMTSPWLFKPKHVGAGLVVNALTKYIGGHGNALGGSVTDTGRYDWTRYDNILPTYRVPNASMWGITQLRKKGLRDLGGTLSAEQAHHLAIGSETLALRMARQCENARALADYLSAHPHVRNVYYPGLPSHGQHAIAREHFRDFGALLSFDLDRALDVFETLNRFGIVVLSSNLGDNRTLAIPVAHTIYWEMGAERREEMGIDAGLIRVSVGIEDIDDLIADFAQALS
jgi:O-acetylhomoserine (thiol)-lyase